MNVYQMRAVESRCFLQKRGPPNTLNYLVRDVVPRMPRGYYCSIFDIGLVINQLMGGGYSSPYTNRKFRTQKASVKGMANGDPLSPFKKQEMLNGSGAGNFLKQAQKMMAPGNNLQQNDEEYYLQTFEYPFSDLIVWAVLTKRQEMAKLMWRHGEQNLAKALVASRLYQAMASEAADDDLDIEVYEELTSYSKVFEDLAVELLEYCYQQEDELTEHLLTASLENWSRQTCLKLAVMARNLRFLAHPISQSILADLWMGGLRMRKNPGFKIIFCLICAPAIVKLDFKTREELQLMPQTEQELCVSLTMKFFDLKLNFNKL